MTETIVNRPIGGHLVVARVGADRVKVIHHLKIPLTYIYLEEALKGFSFYPGQLLSPLKSAPFINQLK